MSQIQTLIKEKEELIQLLNYMSISEEEKKSYIREFDNNRLLPHVNILINKEREMPIRDTNSDLIMPTNGDSRKTTRSKGMKRDEYRAKRSKYHITKQNLWCALIMRGDIDDEIITRAKNENVEIKIDPAELKKYIGKNTQTFTSHVTRVQRGMSQRTTEEEIQLVINQLHRNKCSQKPMRWGAMINEVLAPCLIEGDTIILTPPLKGAGKNDWKLRIISTSGNESSDDEGAFD